MSMLFCKTIDFNYFTVVEMCSLSFYYYLFFQVFLILSWILNSQLRGNLQACRFLPFGFASTHLAENQSGKQKERVNKYISDEIIAKIKSAFKRIFHF